MISQYSQDVDVYDNYGNHLGTFEVDSDYSHDYSQLQGAIEDAAEMAVDKYINYLKQKERKEQEIRARQSWEQRGARVGITIPSYVTSTAAFEGYIIQKEQAAYKRKIRAINQARARVREAESRASQAEARARQAEARARKAEARAAQLTSYNKSYTPKSNGNSSTSRGWIKKKINRNCMINKEPGLFGETLSKVAKGWYIEVNLSETDKSGKYVKARWVKSKEGWINKLYID